MFPQLDSSLAVPLFLLDDDLIASLNKAMKFISTIISLRYPTINNQLRTSSNPRNQATIQDGRVTLQQLQGRQSQSFCTQPKEKMLLVQAQESGIVLDEEQLAFLPDPGVAQGLDTQKTLPINFAFQTDDLDAFDSDCDKAPSTRAVLIAYLSSYDSEVLSEVPISDTYQDNFVLDNYVQEMYYFEQPAFVPTSDNDIKSDNNIISYDQYMKENKSEVVQSTPSPEQKNAMIMSVIDEMSNQGAKCNALNLKNKNVNESLNAELERYKEQIRIFKERQKVDLNDYEKYIDKQIRVMMINRNAEFASFENEIHTLKLRLSKNMKENETLTTTIDF
nr:hypothetical protein [Tanacetum cinerariifolium]